MSEIEFKGELHTIPAGAALVLRVDRVLTAAQAERIKELIAKVLGPDRKVLVLGAEFTVLGVDMGAGDDQSFVTHWPVGSEEPTRIPLQRLVVKDTMTPEAVAKEFSAPTDLAAEPGLADGEKGVYRDFRVIRSKLPEGVEGGIHCTLGGLDDMGTEVLNHPSKAAAKARLERLSRADRWAAGAGYPSDEHRPALSPIGDAGPEHYTLATAFVGLTEKTKEAIVALGGVVPERGILSKHSNWPFASMDPEPLSAESAEKLARKLEAHLNGTAKFELVEISDKEAALLESKRFESAGTVVSLNLPEAQTAPLKAAPHVAANLMKVR